jgi:hypothetical protein
MGVVKQDVIKHLDVLVCPLLGLVRSIFQYVTVLVRNLGKVDDALD